MIVFLSLVFRTLVIMRRVHVRACACVCLHTRAGLEVDVCYSFGPSGLRPVWTLLLRLSLSFLDSQDVHDGLSVCPTCLICSSRSSSSGLVFSVHSVSEFTSPVLQYTDSPFKPSDECLMKDISSFCSRKFIWNYHVDHSFVLQFSIFPSTVSLFLYL